MADSGQISQFWKVMLTPPGAQYRENNHNASLEDTFTRLIEYFKKNEFNHLNEKQREFKQFLLENEHETFLFKVKTKPYSIITDKTEKEFILPQDLYEFFNYQ